MKRPPKPLPTPAELDLFWRGIGIGGAEFIGPVGPPMELWLRDRDKQAAWREKMNLNTKGPPSESVS